MPTIHPRHSITETPTMRAALDELRRRGERIRFGELVLRGAQARLHELKDAREEDARRRELRRDLVRRLHTGEGLDAEAAYEVREHGWTH